MFPLLLVGGAFVASFALAFSVSGVVKSFGSLMNKRQNKVEDIEDEEDSEDKEQKEENVSKIKKRDVIKRINEYKEYINSGVNSDKKELSQIIEDKVATSNLNPNTKKSFELVSKALNDSWDNILKAVNKKIDNLLTEVENTKNYEEIMSKIPRLDYSWFDSKGCESVINKTIQKYSMYFLAINDLEKSLKKFKGNKNSYILNSGLYIKKIMENLENKISSIHISEELFEIELNRELANIDNIINNMNESLKISDILVDIKNLKENDDRLLEKLSVLEEKVVSNGEYLKNLSDKDLKNLNNIVEQLISNDKINTKQIQNLWINLSKEMATRDKEIEVLRKDIKKILFSLRDNFAKKSDVKEIDDNLKWLSEELKKLSLKDLASLSKELESFKQELGKVESKYEKVINNKIVGLEERIREFARRSIAIRVGKKMKEFEDKTLSKITDEVFNKLNASKELSEEEVNDIVDKVIENIKITKK